MSICIKSEKLGSVESVIRDLTSVYPEPDTTFKKNSADSFQLPPVFHAIFIMAREDSHVRSYTEEEPFEVTGEITIVMYGNRVFLICGFCYGKGYEQK